MPDLYGSPGHEQFLRHREFVSAELGKVQFRGRLLQWLELGHGPTGLELGWGWRTTGLELGNRASSGLELGNRASRLELGWETGLEGRAGGWGSLELRGRVGEGALVQAQALQEE